MQDDRALDTLVKILDDENEHVMVSHETAEAMGAVGDNSIKEVLEKHLQGSLIEVSESCDLPWIYWLTIAIGNIILNASIQRLDAIRTSERDATRPRPFSPSSKWRNRSTLPWLRNPTHFWTVDDNR